MPWLSCAGNPSGTPAFIMQTTLDTLQPGEQGEVLAVAGEGPVAQRLVEMGFVPGACCAVIRYAPLGDPLEVRLDEYHLSLRQTEARHVTVRVRR